MKDPFQRIFPYLGVVIFLLLIGLFWKNYNRPYLEYQKDFRKHLSQKGGGTAKPVEFQFGIRQRWVKELDAADRCETCHLGVEDPRLQDAPPPFSTHPDADRHPFEKFGCTVCHGGQGRATPLAAAHGPVENWNQAIYHEDFMENSCALCHGDNVGDHAPVFSNGKFIFDEVGCRGCHKVKGLERTRVGPPLDAMGKRVKADWLYRWLLKPRRYLPRAKMPDYRFTEQEAADIAGFLLRDAKAQAVEIIGSPERGKKIFLDSRCVGCHTVEGRGGDIGPELAKISSKAYAQRLIQDIKNPHKLWDDSKMPIYGFADAEISDLVKFMKEDYVDLELDEEQAARQIQLVGNADRDSGKELIEKYGCTGCHSNIDGVQDRGEIGVELTAIGTIHISRLEFGEIKVSPKERTVPNWLYNKMINPRLFKPGLKMPDFSFNNLDVEAVTTYLLSLKAEEVPAAYFLPLGEPPSTYAPQGEFGKILNKYRCLVCHKINGKGGKMANDLSQEGSRVKREWLQKFMQAPDTIRPILVERMPPFKILDAEVEAVNAYFRTTLVDDRVGDLASKVAEMPLGDPKIILAGRELYYKKYACNACHQIHLKGGLIGPDLTKAGQRLRTEWVVYYLYDPKAFVTKSVEPVYRLTNEEIEDLTAFLVNPKEEK
jgi:cbb3-type cytochrome oxidase cytochrome c subunit